MPFPTLADAATTSVIHPVLHTFTFPFTEVSRQGHPNETPFFDHRFLDLLPRFPLRQRLRARLMIDAVRASGHAAARIPYGTSGLPMRWHHRAHSYSSRLIPGLRRRGLINEVSPGPWDHLPTSLRLGDHLASWFARNENALARVPELEVPRIRRAVDDHLAGHDRSEALQGLLSLTSMPFFEGMTRAPRA